MEPNSYRITLSKNLLGFPGGSDSKESAWDEEDPGLSPMSGRFPGEGNGYPLQYSCLENPLDRGAWWATVHGGHSESDTTEQMFQLIHRFLILLMVNVVALLYFPFNFIKYFRKNTEVA